MKSTINFYYNLYPENIIKQDNFYYFIIGEDKFYFAPLIVEEKMIETIYEELKKRKAKVNDIVKTNEDKIGVLVDNELYALIRVNCIENEIIDLEDFTNIPVLLKGTNWGEIWADKLDYYAYQVSERALKKEAILNSFSYYVGLSENAIQYYNLIPQVDNNVSIQHRRIYGVNYAINYYNPLNMVIDYNIRDIAEYIKFSFFQNTINIDKVINYINKQNYDNNMINLLYARLLFPTYYFDVYDKVLNEESSENELIKIIDKSNDFEKFLQDFYLYYSKNYQMFRIEWLIKK